MADTLHDRIGKAAIVALAKSGTDFYAISVDTSGHLQVDVLSNALPTGAATEATLASIKTAVEKLDGIALETNKLFGYNAPYSERISNLSASAGNNTLTGSTVPAGEVWIVQAVAATDVNSAPTSIQSYARVDSTFAQLAQDYTPVANKWVSWTGEILLPPGAFISCFFAGCTLNDDLYLDIWGYKMKIS